MNDWIFNKIEEKGDSIAIVFDNKEYSYRKLYSTMLEYAALVEKRIPSTAIVSIVSDYCFESVALFFALYKNRNIIVPITTKLDSEIQDRHIVSGCQYCIRIHDGQLLITVLPSVAEPHSLIAQLQSKLCSGLVLFSSGSTGTPKAMIHNLDNLIDSYQNKKGKKLVFLIFLMFDHIGGLNTMLNCVSMGVTMVFPSDRKPETVCSLIEKYRINVLPASPTFLNLILISQAYLSHDLSSLRLITYGTEPMPEGLLFQLKEVFAQVKFLQTFGTSETGISGASSKSSSSTYIKLDDPNTEYKIVENELWIRTKVQILGYLNSSMERFTEDGWFKTGDLVEQDDNGYIKIIGRSQEVINVGGEKVLPLEVESFLFQMPEVQDCIVYGESNPITGQMVVAKIFFHEVYKPSEAKKRVVAFCSGKLEAYKIPAKVLIMEKSEYSERYKKKRI